MKKCKMIYKEDIEEFSEELQKLLKDNELPRCHATGYHIVF